MGDKITRDKWHINLKFLFTTSHNISSRGWESPWAHEQCSLEDSWSVGSFQQNAVLYTTFGRLFEEFVGKYPKYDNIFQTTVDFSRNIKTIPKLTSGYENFS